MSNRTSILIILFFFASITIFGLSKSGYKTFTESQTKSFLIWFATAITTSIAYTLYRFTAVLYKALYYDEPRDLLTVNRIWSYDELAFNASLHASKFGVTLEESEKLSLCSSVESMEDLFQRTSAFCNAKLSSVQAVETQRESWWSFLNSSSIDFGTLISDNKGLACAGALASAFALYCLAQNFGFQFTSLSLFKSFSASAVNLNERTKNLTKMSSLNTNSIAEVKNLITDLEVRTNTGFAKAAEALKAAIRTCADMEGTAEALIIVNQTLSELTKNTADQKKILKLVISIMLEANLIPSSNVISARNFCDYIE